MRGVCSVEIYHKWLEGLLIWSQSTKFTQIIRNHDYNFKLELYIFSLNSIKYKKLMFLFNFICCLLGSLLKNKKYSILMPQIFWDKQLTWHKSFISLFLYFKFTLVKIEKKFIIKSWPLYHALTLWFLLPSTNLLLIVFFTYQHVCLL